MADKTGLLSFSVEDSWSDAFHLEGADPVLGDRPFMVELLSGTGTLTLQKQDPDEGWFNYDTLTSTQPGRLADGGTFRIGVTTGNLTSGPIKCRVRQ